MLKTSVISAEVGDLVRLTGLAWYSLQMFGETVLVTHTDADGTPGFYSNIGALKSVFCRIDYGYSATVISAAVKWK